TLEEYVGDKKGPALEAASREFTKLDTSADGSLSLDEFTANETDWGHVAQVALIVLAVIVLPFVVGHFLANMLQMRDYALRLGVILFAVTFGLVLVIGGWPPALGPDLRGGVILVYEIDKSKQIKEFRPLVIDEIARAIGVRQDDRLAVAEGEGSLIEVRVPKQRRTEVINTIEALELANGVQLGEEVVEKSVPGDPTSVTLVYEMRLDDFRPVIVGQIEEKIRADEDDAISVTSVADTIIEVRIPADQKKSVSEKIQAMDFGSYGALLNPISDATEDDVVVLRYNVENVQQESTMDELIPQLSRRLNRGGVKEVSVRKRGSDQVEIILPGLEGAAIEGAIEKIESAGALEFRIVPTLLNDTTGLADLARETKGTTVYRGEIPVARWVRKSEGVDAGGVITRKNAKGETEVLVLLDRKHNVQGKDLAGATAGFDEMGRPSVNFRMKPGADTRFGEFTKDNLGKLLGIVLDDELMSAATIQSQITDQGQITGRFTQQRVEFVVSILKAGELSADLNKQPISREEIGPLLGAATVKAGTLSMIASMAVVLVFMLVYYGFFAGLVACLALMLNVVLVLAIMIRLDYEFTLAGLAGLVLTVGMAVDANVLIFERIREELDRGAALRMAIRNGFAKATTTIVDANLTTLITAIVLFWIGTEQVKGFAVTLILGITMSMFTAIFCSRVLFDIAEKKFLKKLRMLRILGKTNIDFIGKRFAAATVSCILIAIGLVATWQRGSGILDIDFTGGSAVTVYFDKDTPVEVAEVRRIAEGNLADTQVSRVQIDGQPPNLRYKINTSNRDLEQVTERLRSPEAFGDKLRTIDMSFATLDAVDLEDDEQPATSESPAVEPDTSTDEPKTDGETGTEKQDDTKTDVDAEEKTDTKSEPMEPATDESKETPEEEKPMTKQEEPAAKDEAPKKEEPKTEAKDEPAPEAPKIDGADEPAKEVDPAKDAPSSEATDSSGASSGSLHGLPVALRGTGVLTLLQGESADGETTVESAEGDSPVEPKDDPASTDDGSEAPTDDSPKPEPKDGETADDGDSQGAEEGTAATTPDDAQPVDLSPPPVAKKVGTKTELMFSETISHPSLVAVLKHASEKLFSEGKSEYAEGQFAATFANEDYAPGSNVGYNEWTFEVNLPPEQAQPLLDEMAKELAETPIFPSKSNIGGRVSGEMKVKAISALLVSLLFIVAYIWIRFQNVVFGFAAVIALVHDVLITLGFIAISAYLAPYLGFLQVEPFKISLPIVAAFLTVIGYSLNDTIVVFDRIREVRGKSPDLTADMVNTSINQTLSRTLLTSITTLIVVGILYFFGGPGIHAFAFALVIGVMVGTYSSVFVASPSLLAMMQRSKATATTQVSQRAAAAS
ncbi:MAG: protein translocase subunit SecD, partial [Pirellulales bacterium]|nr:protein translocase subunit SecD [Pirellulales bacterium]